MRAAFRSRHETATDHEGKPAAGIAAVEIALDYLLNDRPEKTALIRFAPEDCKACTPARNGPHAQSGTCRNNGRVPRRGRSSPDVGDDRLPPWREKSIKKRANIIEMTVPPWKDAMRPGSDARINPENVNRSLRSAEEMGPSLLEMKRGSLSS